MCVLCVGVESYLERGCRGRVWSGEREDDAKSIAALSFITPSGACQPLYIPKCALTIPRTN